MISVDAALELIDKHRPDCGVEHVAIEHALGQTLQSDIIAGFSLPRAQTSVMDGYAFRKQDLHQPLTVVGESRAGKGFVGTVKSGEAVRIFTGANLPKGTDKVEIQENAKLTGNHLEFTRISTNRKYIRSAGAFFKKGDVLFEAGQVITPAVISVLASANIPEVLVKRVPQIVLFRSGDELKPVGSAIGKDQIIDSNGPFLTSLLDIWGFDVMDLGLLGDDTVVIKELILHCDADMIIAVGGASVGDYDFMKPSFSDLGYKAIFDRVAIKPGKPVWFSRKSEQIVLGLPGNPSSVFTCSHIFLSHLLGRSARWNSYILTADMATNGVREKYIPARLEANGRVSPLTSRTGQMLSIANADVLIQRRPFADEKLAGEQVDCLSVKY